MSGKSLSHRINVLGGSRQSVTGTGDGRAGCPLCRPPFRGQQSWGLPAPEVPRGCGSDPGMVPALPAGSSRLLGLFAEGGSLHLGPADSSAQPWKPADVFPNMAPAGSPAET